MTASRATKKKGQQQRPKKSSMDATKRVVIPPVISSLLSFEKRFKRRKAQMVVDAAFKALLDTLTPRKSYFTKLYKHQQEIDRVAVSLGFGKTIQFGSHERVAASEKSDLDLMLQVLFSQVAVGGVLPDSRRTLLEIADRFRQALPLYRVSVDCPAITIEKKKGQRIDLVPGVLMAAERQSGVCTFAVPTASGQWEATAPSVMKKFTEQANNNSNQHFYATSRLIKHWCRLRGEGCRLQSLFIECILLRSNVCAKFKSGYQAIAQNAFRYLLGGIDDPPEDPGWFKIAPEGVLVGRRNVAASTDGQASEVKRELTRTIKIANTALTLERKGDYFSALKKWDEIFDNGLSKHVTRRKDGGLTVGSVGFS